MTDDTISRAAAIKTVKKHYRGFDNDLLEVIAYEMERLPSAQPEQPEWAQAVERWYNKALCNPCIHKPLAWALYQVWKEYDNEG